MDNLLTLSQSEKKKILMKCFLKLKELGLKQTEEIKKYMENEASKKCPRILFQELVIGFWEDIKFI